jgi:hypothetical protein
MPNYHGARKCLRLRSNAASLGPAPIISGVTYDTVTSVTSITITWITNIASSSQVNYGLTAGYGSNSVLDPTLVTSHSVTLTGLTEGATYHYRVRSTGSGTSEAIGTDNVVTMPTYARVTVEGMTFRAFDFGEAGNDISVDGRISGPNIDSVWFEALPAIYCELETNEGARSSQIFGPVTIYYEEYGEIGDNFEVFLSNFGAETPSIYIDSEDNSHITVGLATDEFGVITSTYSDLVGLINSESNFLVASGGDGTLVAGADEFLTGGIDLESAATAQEVVDSLNNGDFNNYVVGVANTPSHIVDLFGQFLTGGTNVS